MHIFENFKSFASARLNLFKPLTVLIGPNGSGKSNAIEGIELLSSIAHGLHLHEIVDVGNRGGSLSVRGGLKACPRYGEKNFTLSFTAMIKFEKKDLVFKYSVTIEVDPQIKISKEELYFVDGGPLIFRTIGQPSNVYSSDMKVEYNNFARGGRNPIASVSNNHSALSQYNSFANKNTNKFQECIGLIDSLMKYLKSSFVFDPNPKLMRTYERIGDTELARDGHNLSAVLYGLSVGVKEDQETLERLLGWICQMPEEPYARFQFVTTDLNDVIFGVKEKADGPFVDARKLSDGTLRALAVLTALETVAIGSRVVIEEFDNGLHPSRVHVLMEAIKDCCNRRHLNVFVTTHNPATLNSLDVDQLSGVVLCAKDPENNSFKLISLSELPRYDELLEKGRLGDLVTRRIVEQYLAPNFEEEHKAKSMEWLKSLRYE